MPTHTARVTRIRDLTHDVREVELTCVAPSSLLFAAGQFVTFKVRRPDAATFVTRAYSIASPPGRGPSFDLVFNRVPDGPGSSYLFDLQLGEVVSVNGPSGHFVLSDDVTRDLLFVATGTGVAPFRAMARAELEHDRPRKVTLVWGLRHEEDLYYGDEFAALAAAHGRFRAITTLSRPPAHWAGPRGRVQRVISECVQSVQNLDVYICGNSTMIAEVTSLLGGMGDVPIHKEQYYLDTHAVSLTV